METITYAKLFYRGSLSDEERVVEVQSRDPWAVEDEFAFAVQFYDQQVETVNLPWNEERPVRSHPENLSPKYYYGGVVYSLADVKSIFPDEKILITNMEVNGWKHVVKTRHGNVQPFNDENCEVI